MPVNPAYFTYVSDTNVEALAGPSAVFVCDYSNVAAPAFQRAREKGALVLAYRMTQEVPTSSSGINSATELKWFMGDIARVPRWYGRTSTGGFRSNWNGTVLADIRPGSPWVTAIEDGLAELIESKLADGVFSDGHGAQVWSSTAAFSSWPEAEQTAWALANVHTAQRMDAVRRQLNERFVIVHNNIWALNNSAHPSYKAALEGERYCDGVCIEHHPPTRLFHVNYVAKPFGNLGQRRVIVIANNLDEARVWATKPGVTHVASVNTSIGESYKRAVAVPGIDLNDLRPAEDAAYIARLKQQLTELQAKYDSLFELAETSVAEARRERDEARAALNEATTLLGEATLARDEAQAQCLAQRLKLDEIKRIAT